MGRLTFAGALLWMWDLPNDQGNAAIFDYYAIQWVQF